MANIQEQFLNNVNGIANNMMTQMVCEEKGIDYNQLMQQAQQAHLQNILQQEQAKQFEQVIARHYGAQDTFFGKLKTAFSGESNNGFLMPPMAPQQMSPFGGMEPAQPMNPLSQLGTPQLPNSNQGLGADFLDFPFTQDDEDERIGKVESDIGELKELISGIAEKLK